KPRIAIIYHEIVSQKWMNTSDFELIMYRLELD
ncbi:MAG: hypothetical protein RLZZ44_1622, partial [Bacteroidota bacterium]